MALGPAGLARVRRRVVSGLAARRRGREAARWQRLRAGIIAAPALHAMITTAITERRPFAFGRPGFYEAALVAHGLGPRAPYPERLRRIARDNVGAAHRSDADLDAFVATTVGAMAACDALGVTDRPIPGFAAVLEWLVRPGVALADHGDADPRAARDAGAAPWTHALAGRRVLVVHPFATSIARQYGRWREVTGVADLLAPFELVTLVPPVTFAGAPAERPWHDELADATARMSALEFDVAVVGAGGYGLPLVAHARAMGRVGVHLAGATQLLFGIRGGRWRDDARLSGEMDATWVDPDPSEVPPDPSRVEGGAYW